MVVLDIYVITQSHFNSYAFDYMSNVKNCMVLYKEEWGDVYK